MQQVVTALDDTLRHQTPTTFDQVATTDHRFMDRYWYMTCAPDGSIGMITGLGAYPNMNVMDGYACVVVGGDVQHNLRVSRLLRPRLEEMTSGPLTYVNHEPHRRNQIIVTENAGPLTMDLTFHATEAPRLEAPHKTLANGHLSEDYLRLHQGGTATGTITVGDRTWEVRDWYAAKDHSWGIRSHFGGFTVIKGGPQVDDFSGLFIWAGFTCGPIHGYVQLKENGAGERRFTDGELEIADDHGHRTVRIVKIEHDITFTGNSNLYEQAHFHAVGDTGEEYDITVRPAHIPFGMIGTGYFDGFDDRRGFGAYRGDDIVETDTYQLSPDGFVTFPDGRRGRPWHRELPSTATVNGITGQGYSCALVEGLIDRYQLDLPPRSRQGNGITWEDGTPDTAPGQSQGQLAATPA